MAPETTQTPLATLARLTLSVKMEVVSIVTTCRSQSSRHSPRHFHSLSSSCSLMNLLANRRIRKRHTMMIMWRPGSMGRCHLSQVSWRKVPQIRRNRPQERRSIGFRHMCIEWRRFLFRHHQRHSCRMFQCQLKTQHLSRISIGQSRVHLERSQETHQY